MNKKIYALAACIAFAFSMTSCDDDNDDQDYVAPDVLTGRWVLTEVGSLNAGALNYISAVDGCTPDEIIFEGDTFSSAVSDINIEGNCETVNKQGTWELVDGNLEFSAEADNFTRDVLTLTPSTMVLAYSNSDGQLRFNKFTKQTQQD